MLRVDPTTGLSEPVYVAGPSTATELRVPLKMVREGTHLFADYRTAAQFSPGAIFDIDLANGTNTLVMHYDGVEGANNQVSAIGLVPSDGDSS